MAGVPLYSQNDEDRIAPVMKSGHEEPFRSSWRRDIARLLHSPSFRRLQGKTQVFPGSDSDFFRNRLSHSLEVAQIAKSIAIRLNSINPLFKKKEHKIIPDIVEFAALAHDLGHPPFGHNGEEALHEKMSDFGGFEGNAQTLHILSKTEKKEVLYLLENSIYPFDDSGNDLRAGLNLTARSLASILKYDSCISERSIDRSEGGVVKGYYNCDKNVVDFIKKNVINGTIESDFKTIECSIMDISDDIAYSTYDLEDSFKAGLLSPSVLFSANPAILENVVNTINSRIKKYYPDKSISIEDTDVIATLFIVFEDLYNFSSNEIDYMKDNSIDQDVKHMYLVTQTNAISQRIASNGYDRVKFTSGLVQSFMDDVEVVPHLSYPQLHRARLGIDTFIKVEVLKNITYELIIKSPRMQVVEYRGKDIIESIFDAIDGDSKGYLLLPDDYRDLFQATKGVAQKRVISDFIAGMTDRYAWNFYHRVCGSNPMTIYTPI